MERRACRALFCFSGATLATSWLKVVALDEDRIVLTDADVMTQDLPPGCGALDRQPLPFGTSLPNVFIVGDVRRASMKRVGAAGGEGSDAIPAVHRAIAGWS